MASRTTTISLIASSGIHVALFAGLMMTSFQVGGPQVSSSAANQTVIAFAPLVSQASLASPQPIVSQPSAVPPALEQITPPPPAAVTPPLISPPTPEQPTPEVKLGIDDGRSDSRNWIGFQDPTEFRAPKSTVDQAEVSLNPGNPSLASGAPGKPGTSGSPGLPGQPLPSAASALASPSPASTAAPALPASNPESPNPSPRQPPTPKGDAPKSVVSQEEIKALHATPGTPTPPLSAKTPFDQILPAQEKGSATAKAEDRGSDESSRLPQDARESKRQGDPNGTEEASSQSTSAKLDAVKASTSPQVSEPAALPPQAPASMQVNAPAQVTPPAPAATPSSESSASTTSTPVPPSPEGNQGQKGSDGNNASGANVTGDKPGEKDDREADASAIVDSIEVVPGKPAAAKGLRIQTSRPQWSMTTKLTARPRNPTIRITFGPTGRVTSAEFVRGKATGYTEVDQPLLNAIYRWTARGEAIDKLNPTNPRSGVSITVNILLN